MATLDDLKQAKAAYAKIRERWSDYSGNNPDKYQSELKSARIRVADLTAELKKAGLIEMTDREKLEAAIDAAYPDAKSREIVSFNGQRYRRRFWPAEKSNSGKTVIRWDRSWELLEDDPT